MEPTKREPIASAPVSVVLVAHDAGGDLEEAVQSWLQFLGELQRPYEILLVNDGSSDGTCAQADAVAGQHSQVRVFHHPQHRGLGAALGTGFAAAGHPLLAYSLANKQYRPADLKKLLEAIDQVDLVVGYRVWRPAPLWRQWLDRLRGLVFRVVFGVTPEPRDCWLGPAGYARRCLARWIFGVRVPDPECAFALCRRSIFSRIPLQSDSDLALVEILAKANFLGLWMACAPVSWIPPAVPASPRTRDMRTKARREIWRLLAHADFGPAVLSEKGDLGKSRKTF